VPPGSEVETHWRVPAEPRASAGKAGTDRESAPGPAYDASEL
jgi:hypothetical protein